MGLLHTLLNFQLLVALQQGVKAKPKQIEIDQSSARVVTGRMDESIDSALVVSNISDADNMSK